MLLDKLLLRLTLLEGVRFLLGGGLTLREYDLDLDLERL